MDNENNKESYNQGQLETVAEEVKMDESELAADNENQETDSRVFLDFVSNMIVDIEHPLDSLSNNQSIGANFSVNQDNRRHDESHTVSENSQTPMCFDFPQSESICFPNESQLYPGDMDSLLFQIEHSLSSQSRNLSLNFDRQSLFNLIDELRHSDVTSIYLQSVVVPSSRSNRLPAPIVLVRPNIRSGPLNLEYMEGLCVRISKNAKQITLDTLCTEFCSGNEVL